MPDIGMIAGGAWVPLDEAPELADELPKLPETGQGQTLRWYAAHGPEQESLYAAVGGDCGTEGPYIIGIWCLPHEDCAGKVRPENVPGCEPRYPTFDEWVSLVNAACVAGAMMTCGVISGGVLHEQASGRGLILMQSMVFPDTPAAQRWALANPGAMPKGGLVSG